MNNLSERIKTLAFEFNSNIRYLIHMAPQAEREALHRLAFEQACKIAHGLNPSGEIVAQMVREALDEAAKSAAEAEPKPSRRARKKAAEK